MAGYFVHIRPLVNGRPYDSIHFQVDKSDNVVSVLARLTASAQYHERVHPDPPAELKHLFVLNNGAVELDGSTQMKHSPTHLFFASTHATIPDLDSLPKDDGIKDESWIYWFHIVIQPILSTIT